MKIHFDLTHPKQSLFFPPLMKELKNMGASLSISTRFFGRYGTSIVDILKSRGITEEPTIIESHADTKLSKLVISCRRTEKLAQNLDSMGADGVVCLSSPDAARAAYGLGLKLFCFNDIPEAEHTALLTIPFADHVFYPFCIPPFEWERIVGKRDKPIFTEYRALDPIVWLKDIVIDKNIHKKMGIDDGYILVKHTPTTASFLKDKKDPIPKLVNDLEEEGYKTVVHSYDVELAEHLMPRSTILHGYVDLQSLIYNTKVLVTGGGTTSIEAAYFNVPVVSMRPILTHYDKFLIVNGLMKYANKPELAALDCMEAYHNERSEEKNILHEMEFPTKEIAEMIYDEC